MRDYTPYLLRSKASIAAFRASLGSDFDRLYAAMCRYIDGMDRNRWIDFTKGMPAANVRVAVGLVCCWCNDPAGPTADSWVDFNADATMIRRRQDFETHRLSEPYQHTTIVLQL